ncbi:MAG: 5'/3'-nucleotidase SurE [Clostridia bacterium]|nr:5'/3'-nucleotidase SurE [Clostridia bacterium]
MKILVTNDDGILAPGVRFLAKWASEIGDVTVIAPKSQQSACSQGIILTRPFEVVESDAFGDIGIKAYSADSTPADCIRFAVSMLGSYDIVFSGINNGYNLGYDISYSGTCAAAFEANYAGIKSIAFSTVGESGASAAAERLPAIWKFVCDRKLLESSDMLNVNIPPDAKEIRLTVQGKTFFRDKFIPCEDLENHYMASGYMKHVFNEKDYFTDANTALNGICSVTPLSVCRTDFDSLRNIRDLSPAEI